MDSGELRVLWCEYKCPRGTGKEVGGERIWGKEEPGKSSLSLVGAELQMSQQGLPSSVLDSGQWQTQETWHLAPPPTPLFMLPHCLPSLLHCEFSEQHRCVRFIFVSTTHTAIPVIQQEFNKC